jgi:glycosyltransferase involved in cell wall biosynthesis
MKVVIQVPCLNEAETLPLVFADMPSSIPGIDEIEYLVIDDGCTDGTVEVARALGVRHFVHHTRTQGLGQSFHDGALKALEMGADILVNTDGDNQYPSGRIPDLIAPIVRGLADIVVADRQVDRIAHFSPLKKRLQSFGTSVVNMAAAMQLPDAASGFRAYSRESLIRLNLVTRFSYCMESIIQAGQKRMQIASVTVETNARTRESRLFRHTGEHVARSGAAIVRAYVMYRPLVLFFWLGMLLSVLGLVPFVRYLILYLGDTSVGPGRHLQSLLVGGVLILGALITWSLGVIADLIRINRVLVEETLAHQKRLRFPASAPAGPADHEAGNRQLPARF